MRRAGADDPARHLSRRQPVLRRRREPRLTHVATEDPWDEYAGGWDDEVAVQAYAAAAHDSLLDALDRRGLALASASVCDFGCGTGLLTTRLAEKAASIDAVDTSPAMLARLDAKVEQQGLANVHTAATLPDAPGTHDLVVCSSVLGFVDDLTATVERLVRLLRPGGLLVQWDWERDLADPDSPGLTRDEVRDALTAAGLTAVEVDTGFEVSVEDDTMRPLMAVGQRPAEAQ